MIGFFKKKALDPVATLESALGEVQLPTFPTATLRCLRLLRDPESSIQDVAASIESNPGLVVQLLRMVNSASYGLRQRVDRVAQAVTLLGRGAVENLVVAFAVRGGLKKAAPKTANKRFWHAAATRATMARKLAELLHPATQGQAFVAGMLQDMALPLLAQAHPQAYRDLLGQSLRCDDVELDTLERETFGWDHSIVGASLASRWDLPAPITDAVGGHHGLAEVDPAIHLVSLAKTGTACDVERIVERATAAYNASSDRVHTAIEEARREAGEVSQWLA